MNLKTRQIRYDFKIKNRFGFGGVFCRDNNIDFSFSTAFRPSRLFNRFSRIFVLNRKEKKNRFSRDNNGNILWIQATALR